MVDHTAKVVSLTATDVTPAKMVKALRELHQCLARNKPVPVEVCALVAPALGSALSAFESGLPASLDHSLGLKRHGGVSTGKALINAERDQMIRQLAHSLPQWAGKPHSVIGREMSKEFDRYVAGRWKREGLTGSAPTGEPFSTFWRLKQSGSRMPGAEQIRKILSLVIQDPV